MRPRIAVALALLLITIPGCGGIASPAQRPSSPPTAPLFVERVRVDVEAVTVFGRTTLPEDVCILTELLADDRPLDWWPSDRCATRSATAWQIIVPLGESGAPARLDPSVQYAVQARQNAHAPTGPRFPFDLAPPPPSS